MNILRDRIDAILKKISCGNLQVPVGKQVADAMKHIWTLVHGHTPLVGDDVPAFNSSYWFKVMSFWYRGRYVEKQWEPQINKLLKESACLKKHPECTGKCPHPSVDVCPNLDRDLIS